ncbi:MAG: glycosyltransferase [Candidatus Andeanibacterium colombiense]|uniref:Glycosyltransferase n=1 Tax=Candidatus Andeanibacterium colombiense TaxID=3121345 RepID=A0AAJ5X7Y1_9SPHN|nr:MAG: glycosyltransferase [Sphingomonadaceae bacterium]
MANAPRKLLITTWEGGGSVGPALTVARKLVDAGHDVRVMSDECNRAEAAKAGARFVPWTRAPSRKDRSKESEVLRDWESADMAESFKRVVDQLVAGPSLRYAEDTIEELRKEPADLVVSNELLLGVMAGCEAIGTPFAMMPVNSMLMTVKGAIEMGMLQHFEANPPSDPGDQMKFAVVSAMQACFMHGLEAMNATRAALGLPPIAHLFEQFVPAKKVLLAVSPAFDFVPAQIPPNFSYIGAQLDDPAWTAPWQSPWPADDPRPLVLVGFSTTFQNQTALLQAAIDALGTLPVRGLVTLGPTIAVEELNAPANVEIVPSAPHGEVMKQASLVITHGGFGTLAKALANRLPALVMPQGRDQGGNAEKLMAHGAGLALPPTADSATIAGAVEKLLADPAYAAAAGKLGEAIEREMRESAVVSELEALAA